MSKRSIHYSIKPSNPYGHLFTVTLEIKHPDPQGQRLRLPAWIPGSYMIRDFAKNIINVRARHRNEPIDVYKQDKSTWVAQPCEGSLIVEYEIYAWDLSVRSAHLDQTHGYFNGTSVFLAVIDQEDQAISIDILAPDIPEATQWQVATTLKEAETPRYSFGRYHADDYDDLIDHPVEMSDFTLDSFEACGVSHDVVLSGRHRTDTKRLCHDLQRICEYHIRFFGEPAPINRYLFMTMVVGDGYGGLEHRSSSSLMCSRADLPLACDGDAVRDGYRNYLGLCSHEYFHTWNVKRIKPQKFLPYDLSQEVHTELLWAFEGITSYYDDLGVYRAGLISKESYLELLSQTITRVLRGNGRLKQTVAESSFDAWTRFYKQDENAPNAIVSYYSKGALIALALDLTLRIRSGHQLYLDHVMRYFWREYGQRQIGVGERDIPGLIRSEFGIDLDDFFDQALYSTEDLPLASLLEHFGVAMRVRAAASLTDNGGKPNPETPPMSYVGFRTKPATSGVEVTLVLEDSPAQQAGLSAGDQLIAMDGLKLEASQIENRLKTCQPGDTVTVTGFRRDELMQFQLTLGAPIDDTYDLSIENPDKAAQWLDTFLGAC